MFHYQKVKNRSIRSCNKVSDHLIKYQNHCHNQSNHMKNHVIKKDKDRSVRNCIKIAQPS